MIDCVTHGYVVLIRPGELPFILPFEKQTFSFDDLIGDDDNDLYLSQNGDVEVHCTEPVHTQNNDWVIWLLHLYNFNKPLPACIWGDAFITGENHTLLSYEKACWFKNVLT